MFVTISSLYEFHYHIMYQKEQYTPGTGFHGSQVIITLIGTLLHYLHNTSIPLLLSLCLYRLFLPRLARLHTYTKLTTPINADPMLMT